MYSFSLLLLVHFTIPYISNPCTCVHAYVCMCFDLLFFTLIVFAGILVPYKRAALIGVQHFSMFVWLPLVLLCSLVSAHDLRYAGGSGLRDVRAIAPSYSSWLVRIRTFINMHIFKCGKSELAFCSLMGVGEIAGEQLLGFKYSLLLVI